MRLDLLTGGDDDQDDDFECLIELTTDHLTFLNLLQTTQWGLFPVLQLREGGLGRHAVLFWSNFILEARKSGAELLSRRLRRVGFLQQLTDGIHRGPESELLKS